MPDLAVFISYSHKDARWLNELRPQLQILEDELEVPFWDDTRMPEGVDWRGLLDKMIDSSAIIICFLSANYFASQFIKDVELDLIQVANAQGAPLFPIYVEPFLPRSDHWLTKRQGANKPTESLQTLNKSKRLTLYSDFAEKLRAALIEKLHTPKPCSGHLAVTVEDLSMSEHTRVQTATSSDGARYNIAVVGRTGVGKSELINYLFGEEIAKSGVGKPVTKRGFERKDFELNGIPGTLFDSWGLEIDKSDKWMGDLRAEMRMRGTDKPAEEWFHTIFFCIDACSSRIQDFEISIIKQFLAEKYRALVIFTKSDLAAKKKIEVLKDVIRDEIGPNVPTVSVCSASEELASGPTIQFGASDVIGQVFDGFWQSIIQRLPARCVTLMCDEVEKWRQNTVNYVENQAGVFNQKEIIDYVKNSYQQFMQKMQETLLEEIIESEIKKTVYVFQKFENLLDYSLLGRHKVRIKPDSEGLEGGSHLPLLLTSMMGVIGPQVVGPVVSSIFFGGISLLTAGIAVPIIAGVAYVLGQIDKSNFKTKLTTKIDELANETKQHLKASEPRIEMGMREMLRIDQSSNR